MRIAAIAACLFAAGATARAQGTDPAVEHVKNHGAALGIGTLHGGKPVTWEGGGLRADTVEAGAKRSPGPVQVEAVRFTVAPLFQPGLQEWVRGAFAGEHPTNDVHHLRFARNGSVDKAIRFPSSRIVEVSLPELDAESEDPVSVTVTFQPGAAPEIGGAPVLPAPSPPQPRALLRRDFKISIDGIDCADVFKISAIRVKVAAGSAPQVSNIVLRIYEHPGRFPAWTAWQKSFLVDGQNDDSKEKNGTLQIGEATKPAIVCALKGLGIVRLSALPVEPLKTVKYEVELYCEGITLGEAAAGSATPPPVAPPPVKDRLEDKGARDPADVPRFPDSVRTSFTSSLSRVQSEEKAEYVTAAAVDKVATHMADKMKELGWTLGTRSETGSEQEGTYRLDFRWELEKRKQVARLTLGRTKDGSTTIWWQVTTSTR